MNPRLQDGIYHRPGNRPGGFFGIAFLRVTEGADAEAVDGLLGELWGMWQDLRRGRVRDLPGVEVPNGELTVLLGYGPKVFALPGVQQPIPDALGPRARFRSALPAGGGPLLRGSGLHYAGEVRRNPATEDLCVQFIANTRLAVDRAIVETWKLLHDRADPAIGAASLTVVSFYLGAQREDHRSWIDFHDGISNLRADQRDDVIAIKSLPEGHADAWTSGGTYLAFVRLQVDLAAWRTLDTRTQELAVGRDKASGCPLVAVEADGALVAAPGCPMDGQPIWATANDPIAEPPVTDDPVLRLSHVQRANHHQGPVGVRSSRRIFRQGYEFLEWSDAPPGFRAGLNFVSFQDDTSRVIGMLTQDEWLGATNFGGPPDGPQGLQNLLSVYAAAVYLVPPVVDGEPYPGARILAAARSRPSSATRPRRSSLTRRVLLVVKLEREHVMPIDEEFDPRAVRRILRDLERAASALEQSGEGPDTVTYEHDFPDGPLRVTITARGGTASIALYDPIDDRTIVIELEELRRRIKDL